MSLSLVTSPAAEPLSTAQAKAHLHIDGTDEDTYIDLLISAAREFAETFTRRAFITQTWDLFLDAFPTDAEVIGVPLPRLQSVTTLKYSDSDGTQQTWAASNYDVDIKQEPGRIALAFDKAWPDTREVMNAVEIRFLAGYGSSGTDLPQQVNHAMKILVSHWYENRELVIVGKTISEVPDSARSLLWTVRAF